MDPMISKSQCRCALRCFVTQREQLAMHRGGTASYHREAAVDLGYTAFLLHLGLILHFKVPDSRLFLTVIAQESRVIERKYVGLRERERGGTGA